MSVTRAMIVLTALSLLTVSSVQGQYRDPTTNKVLGFSDAAHFTGNQYVVVFDTKGHEVERRLGLLELKSNAEPAFVTLPAVDWKDSRSKASDLEGICAIPGQPGQFLVTESGSWQGRPGRMFRISVASNGATVHGRDDLPTLADNAPDLVGDQYEGLACATSGPGKLLVVFGERGGSSVFRRGRLRWATYDLASDKLTWTTDGQRGLPVSAPGQWLRGSHRDVTALHLDEAGTLWASASEEGSNAGPFRSIVYAVAAVAPRAAVPVTINTAPEVAWELAGTKVEGLAAPPDFWRYAVLLAASEDEFLGGRVFGLELVVPGR